MLITMVQIPDSYLIPSPRYLAQYLAGYSIYYPLSDGRHVVSMHLNEIRSLVLCHCDQHDKNHLKRTFNVGHIFAKQLKILFLTILGQNSTYSKMDIT